jgi:hypothetical protein
MAATQIDVEHIFTLTATIGDARNAMIRNGPAGTRVTAPVSGGTFEGERLKGKIVLPAGDWVSMRANRVMKLDVRLQLVTDDGEAILMTYQGIGKPDADGVNHIRSAPTFEASDDGDYAWLNEIQAIGVGVSTGGSVTYEVYAVK